MMIKQEIITVELEDIKVNKFYNIKKYHISRIGTARKNPEFDRYKNMPKARVKTIAKYDAEVSRLGGS